jgi:hypothetical protein
MDGGKSPAWLRNAARALAEVLPNATHRTLPGQTHMIDAKAHVAPLVEFLGPGVMSNSADAVRLT